MSSSRHSVFGGSYIPPDSCDFDFEAVEEGVAKADGREFREVENSCMAGIKILREAVMQIGNSKEPHKTAHEIRLSTRTVLSDLPDGIITKLHLVCRAVYKSKNSNDARMAAWSTGIAVGALPPQHSGISMTEIGRQMGVTRAAVSKKSNSLCDSFALPPSHYMKSKEASKSFRDARINFIETHQEPVTA